MTTRAILKAHLEAVVEMSTSSPVMDWNHVLLELAVAKTMVESLRHFEEGLEEEEDRPTKRPANYIEYDQHPLEKFGFE